MPKRRLATLAALLTLGGLLASGCADRSAALRVGDETVSSDELFEELKLIQDDQSYRVARLGDVQGADVAGPVAGSYSQNVIAKILGDRITFLVADDVLADNGIEVTADDRDTVAKRIEAEIPGGTGNLPDRLRDDLIDGLARVTRLQSELGTDKANAALFAAEAEADIEVNSRFGRWDRDTLTIVPPPGATGVPGASATETGSGSASG